MRPLLRCTPFLIALALAGCTPEDGDDGEDGVDGEPAPAGIELEFVGRYQHLTSSDTVGFDVGAAEIPAFDHLSNRLVVVNAQRGGVDVINAVDPTTLTLIQFVDVAALVEAAQSLAADSLGGVNSVSIHNGIAAVAVEANPKTDNGYVAFLNCATLALVGSVQVGALPDMVTFSADGSRVVVANEGEPSNNYAENPAGTVSIISAVGGSFAAPTVASAGFTDWDVGGSRNGEVAGLVAAGLRFNTVTGAVATFSEDMEPEYITVNGSTAYVTLQENNAIAEVNLATATVTAIRPLGFKDYGLIGNEVDLGERDVDGSGGAGGLINLRTWGGVYGAYMPDAIASYSIGSTTYLVTANEGDAREWPSATFADVDRLGALFGGANPPLTGRLTGLEGNVNLGRLNILKDLSTTSRVVTMGTRSFSIWNAATASLVFDSGSQFEQKIAQRYPAYFNASSTNNTLDNRSDDKGPEPEGIAIGTVGNATYAFIGLERIGGIMVYDITNPQAARFVSYRNDRNFAQTPAAGTGGDLAPEGLMFVPAERSPTNTALLIVGHETSGTTVVYEIGDLLPPDANG